MDAPALEPPQEQTLIDHRSHHSSISLDHDMFATSQGQVWQVIGYKAEWERFINVHGEMMKPNSFLASPKMPLHQWYIPRGFLTAEEKAKLAAAITDIYSNHSIYPIAKLLVEVQFFELDKTDRFVGGEASDNQVQIRVSHVARHLACVSCQPAFMRFH